LQVTVSGSCGLLTTNLNCNLSNFYLLLVIFGTVHGLQMMQLGSTMSIPAKGCKQYKEMVNFLED